jgi:cation diffusion facilitator family transporter
MNGAFVASNNQNRLDSVAKSQWWRNVVNGHQHLSSPICIARTKKTTLMAVLRPDEPLRCEEEPGMPRHEHAVDTGSQDSELKTLIVLILTGVMMVGEITAGSLFHSMAVVADGWHMSTHLAAFLIALLAYQFSRRHRNDSRFSFGTGKIGALGAFTSAILLLGVAVTVIYESGEHLFHPVAIQFGEALLVAVLGLAVNLISAVILKDHHGSHNHAHGHDHGHSHGKEDKNLKAAYVHVLADAFTSLTAIAALIIGLYFGILWIDALMGLLGSAVIISWAVTILRDTAGILVDRTPPTDLVDEIQKAFSGLEATTMTDLHVWQIGPGQFAAIVAIDAAQPKPVEEYHSLIDMHEELIHITIQVRKSPPLKTLAVS